VARRQKQQPSSNASTDMELPLVYDEVALEAYCARRQREMNQRWAQFLRLTVPFVARVGTSFSLGQLEKEEVVISRDLCNLLSALGPTFVKLGQLVSSRADLISPGVAEELAKLQSSVPPFSDYDAFKVIEQVRGKQFFRRRNQVWNCNSVLYA
jgi:aarF domain-containing kinase